MAFVVFHMDVFASTFLTAAVEAGIASPTITRHLPILRRCVAPDDQVVLVARGVRPDRRPPGSGRGEFLLVLTARRLVVTSESRLLRRLRLHLNTELRHLHHVSWSPDARTSSVELAATAVDGVRERFAVKAADPAHVWQVDGLLGTTFRPEAAPAVRPARPAARRVPAGRPAIALS